MPHIIAIEAGESQRRQLNEKIQELTKKGWPLNGRFESDKFGTWQALFENAITPGLFVERELIVIESADSFGAFPEELANFLEDDKADCVIILVFNADSKSLKAVNDKVDIIKPEPQVPPWKRQAWLMDLAKQEKFAITQEAAQLLGEGIESQEELRSEVQKLALYADGRDITVEDVESLSFDEGGKAQIIFLDSVCDNKPREAARVLKYLKEGPVLPVLAALTNRLRPAMIISCFQGKYQDEALKACGSDPAKKNYALTKSRNAMRNFGAESIKRFMARSARLSFLEKTNRAEGWQGFEIILWELMMKF
ncbi:MAG: hypothetical protein IJT58_04690 [Synergistaceae bacterium]|nr:hypothetical protein [Synergistaceae bacterium]